MKILPGRKSWIHDLSFHLQSGLCLCKIKVRKYKFSPRCFRCCAEVSHPLSGQELVVFFFNKHFYFVENVIIGFGFSAAACAFGGYKQPLSDCTLANDFETWSWTANLRMLGSCVASSIFLSPRWCHFAFNKWTLSDMKIVCLVGLAFRPASSRNLLLRNQSTKT